MSFLILQLSDPHIGAAWGDIDPVARLERALQSVGRLRDAPDVVLVTGDLAHHATDAEYEQVRSMVERLGLPVHVLPGNRDDRATLRRHFDLPGTGGSPVHYTADLGPLRLVALDTTVPGASRGELEGTQLAWLDAELAAVPDRPTLLAMHHPPLATSSPTWDAAAGLAVADRRALADIVGRHPQVRRVIAGHVHRTTTAELSGCAVLVAPSTFVQTHLSFPSPKAEFVDEPGGYALHALSDGAIASEVHAFS